MIDVKKRMSVKGPGFIPSQVGLILPSESYSDAFLPSAYGSSRQAYLAKERLISAQRSVRASSTSIMNQQYESFGSPPQKKQISLITSQVAPQGPQDGQGTRSEFYPHPGGDTGRQTSTSMGGFRFQVSVNSSLTKMLNMNRSDIEKQRDLYYKRHQKFSLNAIAGPNIAIN